MKATAPASRPASTGGRWISARSWGPMWADCPLRPPIASPCAARCLRTTPTPSPPSASRPSPCMPTTIARVSAAASSGSSPKVSSARPQRPSRSTSSAETRARCTPLAASSAATAREASSRAAGSQAAAAVRFTGSVVPPSAWWPCGASSATSTPMPWGLASATAACSVCMASARSSGRIPPLVQERPDQASARIGAYSAPIPCQRSISASASSVRAKPPAVRRRACQPRSRWLSWPTFWLIVIDSSRASTGSWPVMRSLPASRGRRWRNSPSSHQAPRDERGRCRVLRERRDPRPCGR